MLRWTLVGLLFYVGCDSSPAELGRSGVWLSPGCRQFTEGVPRWQPAQPVRINFENRTDDSRLCNVFGRTEGQPNLQEPLVLAPGESRATPALCGGFDLCCFAGGVNYCCGWDDVPCE